MVAPLLLGAVASILGGGQGASATCLSDRAAQQVAQNFGRLFSDFSVAYANSVLSPDFSDQTDSVNWLQSNGTNCPKPLGTESFSSRADYEAGQATQPNMPFVVENVYHDCTNVFVRWKFDVQPQQVQGIAILGTVLNTQIPANLQNPYLIQHVFSEFNTGAFLVNLGYYHGISPCGNGASKRSMPWLAARDAAPVPTNVYADAPGLTARGTGTPPADTGLPGIPFVA